MTFSLVKKYDFPHTVWQFYLNRHFLLLEIASQMQMPLLDLEELQICQNCNAIPGPYLSTVLTN